MRFLLSQVYLFASVSPLTYSDCNPREVHQRRLTPIQLRAIRWSLDIDMVVYALPLVGQTNLQVGLLDCYESQSLDDIPVVDVIGHGSPNNTPYRCTSP